MKESNQPTQDAPTGNGAQPSSKSSPSVVQEKPRAEPNGTERDDEVHACRLPARVSKNDRESIRESISSTDRTKYFALNEFPISNVTERRMEQVSTVVTSEDLASVWDRGVYECAQCSNSLYRSEEKFIGPCLWPSFREELSSESSLEKRTVPLGSYNHYQCQVDEIYCKKCKLFLGHRFEDGAKTGDTHPNARWRHCVLSLSLKFRASGKRSSTEAELE